MPTPESVTREQANRVRGRWNEPARRETARAALRLRPPEDPTTVAWLSALEGRHAVVYWLESDLPFEDLPAEFADGLTPRVLFSSHPFLGPSTWSILPISHAS